MTERCGKWMPRAKEPCARSAGHCGACASAASVARDKAYNKLHYEAHKEEYREGKLAYYRAYHEANRERRLASFKDYRESPNGRKSAEKSRRKDVESGRAAQRASRCYRRNVDERENIDPRLETLLGGILCPD